MAGPSAEDLARLAELEAALAAERARAEAAVSSAAAASPEAVLRVFLHGAPVPPLVCDPPSTFRVPVQEKRAAEPHVCGECAEKTAALEAEKAARAAAEAGKAEAEAALAEAIRRAEADVAEATRRAKEAAAKAAAALAEEMAAGLAAAEAAAEAAAAAALAEQAAAALVAAEAAAAALAAAEKDVAEWRRRAEAAEAALAAGAEGSAAQLLAAEAGRAELVARLAAADAGWTAEAKAAEQARAGTAASEAARAEEQVAAAAARAAAAAQLAAVEAARAEVEARLAATEEARQQDAAAAGGALQKRAVGEQRLVAAVKTLKTDSKKNAAEATKMKQVATEAAVQLKRALADGRVKAESALAGRAGLESDLAALREQVVVVERVKEKAAAQRRELTHYAQTAFWSGSCEASFGVQISGWLDKMSVEKSKDDRDETAKQMAKKHAKLGKNFARDMLDRTWKKRWFVLSGGCLYYFKGPDDTSADPKGTMFLHRCRLSAAAFPAHSAARSGRGNMYVTELDGTGDDRMSIRVEGATVALNLKVRTADRQRSPAPPKARALPGVVCCPACWRAEMRFAGRVFRRRTRLSVLRGAPPCRSTLRSASTASSAGPSQAGRRRPTTLPRLPRTLHLTFPCRSFGCESSAGHHV